MKKLLIHCVITLLFFVVGAVGSLLWDNYSKDMPRQMPPKELEQAENTMIAEMEQAALRFGCMAGLAGLTISILLFRNKS